MLLMGIKSNRQIEIDRALICRLGGPTKVAQMLGFNRIGGVQRVQNWISRGIPASIKVAYPQLFMRGASK